MTELATPAAAAGGAVGRDGLSRAIASAGLGILSCDRSTASVAFLNEPGADVLRSLTAEGGPDAADLLARAALAAEAAGDPAATGRPFSLSLGDRVLGYSLYPAPDVLWVFFRDVTEKLRLDEVAGSRQATDSLLGVFAALRHELGNPVNAAKTSLAVLRNGIGRIEDDAVRRYVDRALESLARVEAVLGTLRDYGFVPEPQPRAVRVSEVVERAVLECGPALAAQGIALGVDTGEPVLAALADPEAAEQAICALLRRAAQSAAAPAEIAVRVEARPGTVAVRVVSPDGAGADPAATDLGILFARRLAALMGSTLESDATGVALVLRRAEAAP